MLDWGTIESAIDRRLVSYESGQTYGSNRGSPRRRSERIVIDVSACDRAVPLGAWLDTEVSHWRSAAGNSPAGGDWCETVPISDDIVALTIGDVMGHGAPVAASMNVMRAAMLQGIGEGRLPSEILCSANELAHSREGGLIVTAIVAIVDRRRGTFAYANAGHPSPMILTDRQNVSLAHNAARLPLGIFPRYSSADHVVPLGSEALLIMYTDGVTEHARDLIAGELELESASRLAYQTQAREAAAFIATRILSEIRGCDDAAIVAVRCRSRAS